MKRKKSSKWNLGRQLAVWLLIMAVALILPATPVMAAGEGVVSGSLWFDFGSHPETERPTNVTVYLLKEKFDLSDFPTLHPGEDLNQYYADNAVASAVLSCDGEEPGVNFLFENLDLGEYTVTVQALPNYVPILENEAGEYMGWLNANGAGTFTLTAAEPSHRLIIQNGYIEPKTADLTVKKIWVGQKEKEITFELWRKTKFGNEELFQTITLTDDGTNEWCQTLTGIDRFRNNDGTGTWEYWIKEEPNPNYEADTSQASKVLTPNAETVISITNTRKPDPEPDPEPSEPETRVPEEPEQEVVKEPEIPQEAETPVPPEKTTEPEKPTPDTEIEEGETPREITVSEQGKDDSSTSTGQDNVPEEELPKAGGVPLEVLSGLGLILIGSGVGLIKKRK